MLKKTLKFVLEEQPFKILGSSRTDAMVSAQNAAFELFLDGDALQDLPSFLRIFNLNLPPDIRASTIEVVDKDFNIIQNPKEKEYVYLFSFGAKNHPFCAPFLTSIFEMLNLDLMQQGAALFEGTHDFKSYCTKPTGAGNYTREILKCKIVPNDIIEANFFPKESYALHVQGTGFLRNQVRLMMGSLIQLGKGEIDLVYIEESLRSGNKNLMNFIAPASGLILNKIEFT